MIGQSVAHYDVRRKLGEGGMGVVYEAHDTKLDRPVALKFLPPHIAASETEKARFLREARSASALAHPNILVVHDLNEHDGKVYLVMEYLPGETLRARLTRGSMAVGEILNVVAQIAAGLAAAHAREIIHRDIKPENIMLTGDGRVKIMDFGLAKPRGAQNITQTGCTIGTIAYMAPEQILDGDVDARADLWSLGVVLYEMLANRPPFGGGHTAAAIYEIINVEPDPVERRRTDCPPGLSLLTAKLLAKTPSKRVQSAQEIVSELSKISQPVMPLAGPAPEVRPSIAVLPFADMSPAKDQDYFCDGVTEEIINALTKLEGLRVVSRTSAFVFKGKDQDIRAIGEALNVSTLLEGSVRKAGNRVRITAQLIKVADGFHLWSERYDRDLEDVFEVQDDISRTIVETLKVKLLTRDDAPLVRKATDNPEAYILYLRGRHHWNRRTKTELERAIAAFTQAIELDPRFALAHAGLADALFVREGPKTRVSPDTVARAREAADHALRIDPTLAEPHATLGLIAFTIDWEFDRAESEFRRALELNPGYATAYHWYTFVLELTGRREEAIEIGHKSRRLDPLSPIISWNLGSILLRNERFEEALAVFRDALQLAPEMAHIHGWIGITLSMMGRHEEATAAGTRAAELDEGGGLPSAYALALITARRGEPDAARGQLEKLSKMEDFHPAIAAWVAVELGDHELALDLLEEAYQVRSWHLLTVINSSRLRVLHNNPRFQDLLRKVGLPVTK